MLSQKNSGCHEIQIDNKVHLVKVKVNIHIQQPLMSSINESEYVTFLLLVVCFRVVLIKMTCWPENKYVLLNGCHITVDCNFQQYCNLFHPQFLHPSLAMYILMSHNQNEELKHNTASENAATLKYL